MAVSPLECEPQPDSHERRELDPDTCYREYFATGMLSV